MRVDAFLDNLSTIRSINCMQSLRETETERQRGFCIKRKNLETNKERPTERQRKKQTKGTLH